MTQADTVAAGHPIDWSQPSSHVSGLPVGTERQVWRNGQHQIARLSRILANGERWDIYTAGRHANDTISYLYSEGWRYVVEHTI